MSHSKRWWITIIKIRLIAAGTLTAAACHSVKEDIITTPVPQGDTISSPELSRKRRHDNRNWKQITC